MLDYALLQKLCTAHGIAGHEDAVRELILSEIRSYADSITIDHLGNLLVFKKGRQTPAKKLLLSKKRPLSRIYSLISALKIEKKPKVMYP